MDKRGSKKQCLSVTIKSDILLKFKKYCSNKSINKSQLVEKLIVKYLGDKNDR